MTTGRRDGDGDPGSTGHWKDGFNLDCGLPGTLLMERQATGPWRIVENPRASKNRFIAARIGASKASSHQEVEREGLPVAWIGHDLSLGVRPCERFNGYEMARDFPVKA